MNVGDPRIFEGVRALVSVDGGIRKRLQVAASIMEPACNLGLESHLEARALLIKLLEDLKQAGPILINGQVEKSAIQNTLDSADDESCTRYALAMLEIWRATLV